MHNWRRTLKFEPLISETTTMISIIVPVFNVEKYLSTCLDSIIKQTYTNLEILLIDDGSQDRCGDICEEYAKKDGRIRVFHVENQGLSAARNLGLQEAEGGVIGFVDSDDWIEPDMYEVLLGRMRTTGADICVCGYWSECESSTRQFHYSDALYSGKEAITALIHGKVGNYTWNKLYRRELFEDVSFPVGRYYEDVDTLCEVLSNSSAVAVLDAPKYHYRQRFDSITNSHSGKNLFDYADAYLARLKYLKEQFPQIFEENKEEILESVATSLFRVWRWWNGCTAEEKEQYADRLDEYERFSKENFSKFGMKSWSASLRLSTFFIRRKNRMGFAYLFFLNKIVRCLSRRQYSF